MIKYPKTWVTARVLVTMIINPKSTVEREHGKTKSEAALSGNFKDKETQNAPAINMAPKMMDAPNPMIGLISERMDTCRMAQNKINGTRPAFTIIVIRARKTSWLEMEDVRKKNGRRLSAKDWAAKTRIMAATR
jgi:hypothetical protein